MATRAKVTLHADLTVQISSTASSCASPGDPGFAADAEHAADNGSAEQQAGQKLVEVDSPSSFHVLGLDSTMRGRLLWLRVLDGGDIDVRVTHATQGNTTYPVHGLLVLECSEDELITGLAVQGTATIEWCLVGENA